MADGVRKLEKSFFKFTSDALLSVETVPDESPPPDDGLGPELLDVKPGDQVSLDDCDKALAILNAAERQKRSISEKEWGTVEKLIKGCFEKVDSQLFTPATPPEPEPSEGPTLPAEEDTPDAQGAPDVPVAGVLSWQRSPYDVDADVPTDAIFAQQEPTPPELALDVISPSPSSEEEALELVEKWLKNSPQPGYPHPTYSREFTRALTPGGDPIELFSGLLMLSEIDLEIPAAVLPLRLTRAYRSGRPYFGPWGFNWDHNYNAYVRELADGGIAYWTGALQEMRFHWDGGAFQPQRALLARLERIGEQQYQIVKPAGLLLHFERPFGWTDAERIPLIGIHDRHGNSQALTYDQANRLTRVEDDDGRWLLFSYGLHGLLERISDASGREVHYEYDVASHHLVEVDFPPTASYASGFDVSYEYSYDANHPAMRHNVVRVIDAERRTFVQTEYGGPDSGLAFNRVVGQLSGDFQYRYEYQQIQYVPPGAEFVGSPATRTLVRPPDGSLHTYTFNYRGDLLDHRFRLNVDGSFRVVAAQWEYDEQGNVTAEVHPDGARTQVTYDSTNPDPCARGNLLKVELFAPSQFVTTSRVVFEATYGAFQLPREAVDERGSKTRMIYDFDVSPGPSATGRLARVEFPEVQLPDGTPQPATIEVETNLRGQITAMIDAEGTRDEIEYGTSGLTKGFVKKIVHDASGVGQEVQLEYDTMGYMRRRTLAPNVVTETVHNARGEIEEIVLPAVDGHSASMRFRYDPYGQPVRVEQPRGSYTDHLIADDHFVHLFLRNALGHVSAVTLGANTAQPRKWRLCVDHDGRPLEELDPVGLRIRRRYDERGLLLKHTSDVGGESELVTRFFYDRPGRLIRRTDADGRHTELQYDPWGRVSFILAPNGTTQNFEWGPGDVLFEMNVHGDPGHGDPPRLLLRSRYQYDERGRLIRENVASFASDPATAVDLATEFFYDAQDRLRRIRNPRGGETRYDYDGLDRLTRLEDPFGNVATVSINPVTRMVSVTQEDLESSGVHTSTWHFRCDVLDRLRELVGPDGHAVEVDYDDRGLLLERREPLGVRIRFRHGFLGEMVEKTVDPGGLALVYRYEYDPLGRRVAFLDPAGQKTSWTRDRLGRLTKTALPGGRQWDLHYGANGRLTEVAAPGGSKLQLSYHTDSALLASLKVLAGPGVEPVPDHEFQYDGMERLTLAVSASETVKRRFDSQGRLIWEEAHGKAIATQYDDLLGNWDLVYPDGRRERTSTDLAGRPTSIVAITLGSLPDLNSSLLTHVEYAGPKRLDRLQTANGVVSSFVYDHALRPTRIAHTAGQQTLELCRSWYDGRNRHRAIELATLPGGIRYFEYDRRDRLVGAYEGLAISSLPDCVTQSQHDTVLSSIAPLAAAAASWETFDLGAADFRASRSTAAGTSSYTFEPGHRLTAVGNDVVSHSDDGTRTADAARHYDVDALGRVVRVRDAVSSNVLAELGYDALSRVTMLAVEGKVLKRWYGAAHWVHEEDGDTVTRQRTPHPLWPVPLLQRTPQGPIVLHHDGALSNVLASDANGSVVQRVRYETFGAPQLFAPDGITPLTQSPVDLEPCFGGMAFLSPVSLYQAGRRLYDPGTGLFLSQDPQAYAGGPNPYQYVRHNPVDLVDLGGELPFAIAALTSSAGQAGEGAGGAPLESSGGGGGLPAWHQQAYAEFLRARDPLKSLPILLGITNAGVGTVGMIIAVPIMFSPVGWAIPLAGALLFAGSAMQTGAGSVLIGMGSFGLITPEKALEVDDMVAHGTSIASIPGLVIWPPTAALGGDPETASFASDLADLASGPVEAFTLHRKFMRAYRRIAAEKQIEMTFEWNKHTKRAMRETFGLPHPEKAATTYHPAWETAAGRLIPEFQELPHGPVPQRSDLLPLWLKNSPFNVYSHWGSMHAVSDPYRFQTAPRRFKLEHPWLLQQWEAWKAGKTSPYWHGVAPLLSLPPWMGQTVVSGLRLVPGRSPKK
jgi:RHS repeat-associated protein